jgi:circadian clock protein KaiC
LIRNMRSIGLNLGKCVKSGLLQIHSSRASFYGLEMHLALIHKLIQQVKPDVVVVDPIGALIGAGTARDANAMMVRLIDFLKLSGITAVLTNLTSAGEALERTELNISSIVDTWILLRDIELGGERNRAMYVLKSRGMSHSNQLREYLITEHGVDLLDVYVGPEGVLTGSSRVSLEAREKAAATALQQEADRRQRERRRRREALEARITAMRKEFEVEDAESVLIASEELARKQKLDEERRTMALSRQADEGNGSSRPRKRENSR